jgi:paired small multidrug resistance pump
MIFDAFSIMGWIGGVLLILAYFLLIAKKLKSHSIAYNLLNAFGGIGLAVSTFTTKSWPSVTINIIWVGIAAYSIFTIRKTKPVYKELKVKE